MCKDITLPLNIESPMRNRITYKQTRNPLGPVLNYVWNQHFSLKRYSTFCLKQQELQINPQIQVPSVLQQCIFYSDSWTVILRPVHTGTLILYFWPTNPKTALDPSEALLHFHAKLKAVTKITKDFKRIILAVMERCSAGFNY